MLAKYVEAKRTPLTFDRATFAMRAALAAKLGSQPAREVLALALAKTALETGRWQQIWAFNWGNVKASPSYQGSYCCIELNEVIGGKVVWFAPQGRVSHKGGPVVAESATVPPGHPQSRMRAYESAEEGASAYVEFVAGGRYAGAWQDLLRGDAAGYVHKLKLAGYFTADEATYRSGVERLQREFITSLPPTAAPVARTTLRQGDTGPAVEAMQAALNAHGAKLVTDGGFGAKTAAALKSFQAERRLIADGVCGPATWAVLEST